MDVPGLPSLSVGDMYSCFFEDAETAASLQGTTVTCATPEPHRLPPVPQGDGKMCLLTTFGYSCEVNKEMKMFGISVVTVAV